MTKNLQIMVNVIYSPYDDALGGKAVLHTREEVIEIIHAGIKERINKKIPGGYACSLVIGDKIIDSGVKDE